MYEPHVVLLSYQCKTPNAGKQIQKKGKRPRITKQGFEIFFQTTTHMVFGDYCKHCRQCRRDCSLKNTDLKDSDSDEHNDCNGCIANGIIPDLVHTSLLGR